MSETISLIPASKAFEEAVTLRDQALESAALVARVSCAEEQLAAVEAQKQLGSLLNHIEGCRIKAKEPALTYGRQIDEAAKQFTIELKEERLRLDRLVADFQALELAKVRAAQAAENERLAQLEREKFAAMAQAKSHEQLEAVQAEFNEKVREVNPPLVAPRSEGQIVKEVWVFEVWDALGLAHSFPRAVNIEPRKSEITALLDSLQSPEWVWTKAVHGIHGLHGFNDVDFDRALGIENAPKFETKAEGERFLEAHGWKFCCMSIRGVRAWKEVKATVRAGQVQRRIG